jgi:DNA-binding MarR family transcriptional regulator
MRRKIDIRQYAVKSSRTPAGDALSEFASLVLRLNNRLVTVGDALASPVGQSSARWQVLACIQDTPKTVAHIARILCLKRQSVQRVADLLTNDELTEYVENPDHLRAKFLKMTSRGLDALGVVQAAQRSWANRVGASIGEKELRAAAATLRRVLEALHDAPLETKTAKTRPPVGPE